VNRAVLMRRLRDRIARRVLQDDLGGAQALADFPGQAPAGERPVLAEYAEIAALAGRSGSNSMVVAPGTQRHRGGAHRQRPASGLHFPQCLGRRRPALAQLQSGRRGNGGAKVCHGSGVMVALRAA
jgi:hypothetical protein